ncbi:MAG: hypothetical protein M1835_003114 [Candelina submexicana]|nr:MAG: hypothetical protein M1835_003114 [Candelina submexicana]
MPSISSRVLLSVIAVAGLFQSLATGAPVPAADIMARGQPACSNRPGDSGVGCYTFKPAPVTFPPGQQRKGT